VRRPASPLFLERESYRRRRLIDAVRLLPVLGLVLFLMPMLWTRSATATGLVYLFMVWSLLVAISFWLSRRIDLRDPAESAELPPAGGSRAGSDGDGATGTDGATGGPSALAQEIDNGGR